MKVYQLGIHLEDESKLIMWEDQTYYRIRTDRSRHGLSSTCINGWFHGHSLGVL